MLLLPFVPALERLARRSGSFGPGYGRNKARWPAKCTENARHFVHHRGQPATPVVAFGGGPDRAITR